ncbi:MAG: polysaccharide biosynthesis tyrosine autokinase [Calditrichaeota bacterium]|nr:MAG: polysaccharide biosynthesis tyrosine autokinase [Calditrichota bacterium]
MEEQLEREITLKDMMRILYRGRWVITSCFLAVMALTVYYTFTVTPEYEASAKVMIRTDATSGIPSLFDMGGVLKQETVINNQVEILKSRTLAETVLHRLQQSDLADKLEILGNGEHGHRSPGMIASFTGFIKGIFGIESEESNEYTFEDMVQELLDERLSVTPIRDTEMIEIKVRAVSPEEAAFITNTLTAAYREKNRLMSQEEVRQVKNFLEEQLQVVKKQLAESENKLKQFKETQKVVALSHETEELIKKLAEFETLYNEAKTELNSFKERLSYIDKQLGKSKQNFDIESISATTYFEELKKEMATLQTKRASYVANMINQGVYNKNDIQLQKYDEQISILTDKMKSELAKLASQEILNPVAVNEELFARKVEVEANIEALKPKVTSLKKIVDDYEAQLETLPDKSLKLARLERSARVDEKIFIMMKEKYEESRINEVGQLGDVRIIDPAKPPSEPIKPKKKLNMILGMLVGIGLGIGVTFLLEAMDNSVRTIEDLEKLGLPVLGSIPVIKEEDAMKRIKVLPQSAQNGNVDPVHIRRMAARLITHFAPKSPISEAYRTFRTNIQYTQVDKPIKSLLVTSPGPGEGKSTSVANLAITMAQMGSRVILVDADLRRPVLHSVFDTDRRIGLTNVLVGRVSLDDAVKETEINNLYLLPSGTLPPNPSELLGSTAMKQLLDELKQRFDMVLFDSPPIIAVTDAAVLSSKLDAVIVVVKSAQTDREAAFRATALLKNVKTHVLGALLNGVRIESMYGSYYYYYHYYYYGKEGDRKRKKKKKRRSKT